MSRISSRYLRALLALLFLLALVGLPTPTPVAATNLLVTKAADTNDGTCDGDCSLREAIAVAVAGDIITFNASVTTVTLTSAELTIDKNLTIDGGAAGVTVRRDSTTGTPDFGIFAITGGTVTLNHLTITNGKAPTGGGIFITGFNHSVVLNNSTVSGNTATSNYGGGVHAADSGKVTLTDSTISDNTASSGGGLAVTDNGSVVLTNSIVRNNTASSGTSGGTSYGGGLLVYDRSTATLNNSTIKDNTASALYSYGGGLYVGGIDNADFSSVIATNSTVSGNTASTTDTFGSSNGGGLAAFGSTSVTVTNSTISNNTASATGASSTSNGGGLASFQSASVKVTGSPVSGNTASATDASSTSNGGGFYAAGGTVTVTSSTVSSNTASAIGTSNGGGFYVTTSSLVTVINSTVSGNTAATTGDSGSSTGGGFYVGGTNGNTRVTNSTVSGNTASATGASGSSTGGGFYVGGTTNSSASLSNSTVSGNTASATGASGSNDGSGFYVINKSMAVLAGTIIVGEPTVTTCYKMGSNAFIVNNGYNLDSGTTCGFGSANNSLSNTDPLLGPLADNGGTTLTHLPGAGSPALDKIPTGTCTTMLAAPGPGSVDQRGTARPQGSACDIGSVESVAAALTPQTIDFPQPANRTVGDAPFTVSATGGGSGNPVTFTTSTPAVCTAGGTNGATITLVGAGDCTVTASQAGNATYAAATPVPHTFAVAAAALIVTNGNDSGPGSLRDVTAATAAGGTVRFATGVTTVTLTSAQLTINKNLTIDGGAAGVTVQRDGGAAAFRVFSVTSGTVAFNRLTIRGGSLPISGVGGGLLVTGSASSVTLTDTTVSGNSAVVGGGGVAVTSGAGLTLTGGAISGNTATSGGGGVYVLGTGSRATLTNVAISGNTAGVHGGVSVPGVGSLTLIGSTVSGNTAAAGPGGGGGTSGGSLTLINSTVSGNTATGAAGHGGGLSIFGNGSSLTLTNSTVSGNTAARQGGGIHAANGGSLTATNSTVSGNTAAFGGGGVYTEGGGTSVTLTSTTIVGNTATNGAGGGLYAYFNTSTTLAGTIVAGASACRFDTSPLTDNGYNLESGTGCGFTAASSRSGLDPLLGPLADNGGPTLTHLPGLASPARDRIPTGAACPATDQRGTARPQGPRCDIGAVEAVPASSPANPDFTDVPTSDPAYAAIAALVERGVIKGYATPPNTFGPGDDVQRSQVAAMLVRALGWQGRPTGPRTFTDLTNPGDELQRAGLILANTCDPQGNCVAKGYVDGRFGNADPVSHAQVVAFVVRAFGLDPAFAWQLQAGATPYSGVPPVFAAEIATFHRYAGTIPDAPTTQADWDAPADRAWIARVLWAALQSTP